MNDVATHTMSIKERLFHTILFEVSLLFLVMLAAGLFSESDTAHIAGVAIGLSAIAMVWNFIYNWLFDRFFTQPKIERGALLRLFHAVAFEGGLLVFSLPLIAWALNMGLWQAFILDIGLTVFVVIYTVIFNWVYDHIRARLL